MACRDINFILNFVKLFGSKVGRDLTSSPKECVQRAASLDTPPV
jgi:hypothetical protein